MARKQMKIRKGGSRTVPKPVKEDSQKEADNVGKS